MNKDSICTTDEKKQFQQLVGKLNWMSNQTRPDIAFDVCELSAVCISPKISDILRSNKVLGQVKRNKIKMKFPKLEDLSKVVIRCFSDASLNNLPSGNSCGGFVIFLVGDNGNCFPVSWKSKSIKRVVRSAIASETCSAVDALDCSYYLSYVLNEILHFPAKCVPIDAYVDNKSLYRNVHTTTMAEERRLRIDIATIRQMLDKNEIRTFNWIPTGKQLSDCLTKRTASDLNLSRVIVNGNMQGV